MRLCRQAASGQDTCSVRHRHRRAASARCFSCVRAAASRSWCAGIATAANLLRWRLCPMGAAAGRAAPPGSAENAASACRTVDGRWHGDPGAPLRRRRKGGGLKTRLLAVRAAAFRPKSVPGPTLRVRPLDGPSSAYSHRAAADSWRTTRQHRLQRSHRGS